MSIAIFATLLSTDQPQVGISRDKIDAKAMIAKTVRHPDDGSSDRDRNASASRNERFPAIENAR